jgi:ABC-2 type transport system ATP-binding protein
VNTSAAIELDHVGKRFRLYHERQRSLKSTVLNRRRGVYEEFWAVDDVSCEVARGETFGIIGTNGSGKSTLLKCLTRILRPDRGRVAINGTTAALLELGAGFHPELTGRENVYLNGAILGMSRREIARRFDGIVDFSGLERFIDSPVKNYSSGMYAKLGFAVAVHVDPEILLVDEVLAVGDESFQRRCAGALRGVAESAASSTVASATRDRRAGAGGRVITSEYRPPRADGASTRLRGRAPTLHARYPSSSAS